MNSAYYLTRLLESEPGIQVSGTSHVLVDGRTACHLARRMEICPLYTYTVLGGQPVKVALGITEWCLAMPDPMERIKALAHWSAKKGRPVNDDAYFTARRRARDVRLGEKEVA